MKCLYCNQEHNDTIKFCPNTGKKLIQEQIKCNNCGNIDLTKDQRFCTNCGNLLVWKDLPNTPPSVVKPDIPNESQTKPLYIGGNVVFHIFAIFLWAVMILSGIVNLFLGEYSIALGSLLIGGLCGGLYYYAKN